MKIVLAPNAFKESLTALEAANAMEEGIKRVFPRAAVVKVPLADGGDGTISSLLYSAGGKLVKRRVTGPLGKKVTASFGVLPGGTAVIEMASASGLRLVPQEKRNPMVTTTYGTGELILAAIERGCTRIIVGAGGSATNDAGAGMAQAMGGMLLDSRNRQIPRGGRGLLALERIDISRLREKIKGCTITGICDVDNPLYGPRGAAAIYGPQKGATPRQVRMLDSALRRFSRVARKDTGIDLTGLRHAGAAGGLGAGFAVFLGARLAYGADVIIDMCKLGQKLKGADLLITGEGQIDGQSVFGKCPVRAAKAAKRYNIPVVALCGAIGEGAGKLREHGIDAVFAIEGRPMSTVEAIRQAYPLLRNISSEVASLLRATGNRRLRPAK